MWDSIFARSSRLLAATALISALGPGQGAAAAPLTPNSSEGWGLDSLAAVTLERAFDLLEIAPTELGFDKLYAEDDTFRLKLVEELLGDPLRVPAWQERTADAVRSAASEPEAIALLLAEISEAAPRVAPAAGAGLHNGRDAVARFIERCSEAERELDRAFALLSPEERAAIAVLAPAFWGDWEEPGSIDRRRKGEIHFERGIAADTTIALSEKPVLDAAAKLDRAALTTAAGIFAAAWRECAEALLALPLESELAMPGVAGMISASYETPWGLLVIGGPGENAYGAEALDAIAFILEPGGDDLYRGRAASAIGGVSRPFAGIWDAAGDDLYDGSTRAFVVAGAVLGIAFLVDRGGNDLYRGGDGSSGAGFFGCGILHDAWGVDCFEGRNFCQGAGAFGIGAVVSDARSTPPAGPAPERDRAFETGLVPVPGTGAVPIRHDENDLYRCDRQSQGFASTFGAGLLYDRAGSDTYRSGGGYLHKPLRPDDFQSLSQGFSIGFRPRAGGGVGILIDEEGNDFYDAEIYAQGTSYWYSIGMLHDRAGNDRYLAAQYAQGAGVHLAVGTLWDRGGNDHYVCHLGVTQGTAHDLSVGWQIDESGDDYYVVSDGQGMSIANSAAIFIDGQGNDMYATTGAGQGALTWARDFCGAGIFLDLEGRDIYPAKSGGADGAIWSHELHALGIDLDRDIELPGEVIPEPVLTAADSARSVEDLFEEASIWEVGTAREKVARPKGSPDEGNRGRRLCRAREARERRWAGVPGDSGRRRIDARFLHEARPSAALRSRGAGAEERDRPPRGHEAQGGGAASSRDPREEGSGGALEPKHPSPRQDRGALMRAPAEAVHERPSRAAQARRRLRSRGPEGHRGGAFDRRAARRGSDPHGALRGIERPAGIRRRRRRAPPRDPRRGSGSPRGARTDAGTHRCRGQGRDRARGGRGARRSAGGLDG